MRLFGAILVFVGIILASGSGGDCDGACMEEANSMAETLLYAVLGLGTMATGAFLLILSEKG